jgi:16S rRNA (cytidine1402-2'-O)-methyltransferase
LFLVGTPIGNLGDITLRAIETLKSADRILAEDTRRTRALLSHLGIARKPVERVDAHTRPEVLSAIIDRLRQGERVALVTDAGMPTISDPGTELVRLASTQGVAVSVIPGPSAVSTAVALSGLVDGAYTFWGFVPRKGAKRRALLSRIAHSSEVTVLFESPQRTPALLAELAELCPERPVVVCRELTKLHEQVLRGTAAELAHKSGSLRGEVTVVIGAAPVASAPELDELELERWIETELAAGTSARDIAARLSAQTGLSRNTIYAKVVELKAR